MQNVLLSLLVTIIYVDGSLDTADKNCRCAFRPEYPSIGPFCSSWTPSIPPYCFLAGGSKAKFCRGAVKVRIGDFYFTNDSTVCKKSRGYIEENCVCGFYNEIDWLGPFCAKWLPQGPQFCFLSGGLEGRFCPEAWKYGNESIYWTEDEGACNRSKSQSKRVEPITLGARPPFKPLEILEFSIISLEFFIGTIGNALVIRTFVSPDALNRPGSKFIIVLACVDFLSSLWIPFLNIIDRLYDFKHFNHWPFSELSCRVLLAFYPFLFYSNAWLLVAVSLERARAIYRPLARRLRADVFILVSVTSLCCSLLLQVYDGIHYKMLKNQLAYINGTTYEYSECTSQISNGNLLANTLLTFSLGIWLPMIVTAIVYVLMYFRLKKQAVKWKENTTLDANTQLTKISRTFVTVIIVFYICYLPATLLGATVAYLKRHHINLKAYNVAWPITVYLMNVNSCLNPMIYNKIHIRVYRAAKKTIRRVLDGACCSIQKKCCPLKIWRNRQSLKRRVEDINLMNIQ